MHPVTELHERIETAVQKSDANIGVALCHMESGESFMLNADTPVPLASVVKIPVIVAAFHHLRQDRLRLDDRWSLQANTKALGSGILRHLEDGLALTVKDLLTLMTIISDNTATDMLMLRIGPQTINSLMHSYGLTNLHVAHTLNEIFADMLPSSDPDQDAFGLAKWEAEHGVRREGFSYSLGADNNVGTPRELTRLVEMIFRAELLDRPACDTILEIMLKQQLNDRLPRFLPPGTPVAHKTGSFSGVRNDCGIIYVNDHSHIAITTLSTWDHASCRGNPQEEWRRIIEIDAAFGAIGLAAYEAFA